MTSSRRNEVAEASKASDETINDVVAACQRGDRDAQRRLFEQCQLDVYHLMVRMVGEQEADDLTQQTFVKVFRAIGQFAGQSRFQTWLYRVATNEALQHLRRSKGRKTHSIEHDPTEHRQDHRQTAENKEILEVALERLEPQLRSIFLLREVSALSYEQISEVTQIPAGTVGSRLNRARRDLQQHLRDLGWEP